MSNAKQMNECAGGPKRLASRFTHLVYRMYSAHSGVRYERCECVLDADQSGTSFGAPTCIVLISIASPIPGLLMAQKQSSTSLTYPHHHLAHYYILPPQQQRHSHAWMAAWMPSWIQQTPGHGSLSFIFIFSLVLMATGRYWPGCI